MLYTSYFAKMKSLPANCVTVAICGKSPDWYTGLEYKKLAPKWSFFKVWKKTYDNDYYIKEFNSLVLNGLNANRCLTDLLNLLDKEQQTAYISGDLDIVLLCYEKPCDFCHRHLVADWFNQYGIACKEYEFK